MALLSNKEEGNVSNVDIKIISKIISKDKYNFIAQMFLMVCEFKRKELIPQAVEKLMGMYEELF